MERLKLGDIKYVLYTGWGIHHTPAWAIWKVRIIDSVETRRPKVKFLEKKLTKYFTLEKDMEYNTNRSDLLDDLSEAKEELVKKITENRL